MQVSPESKVAETVVWRHPCDCKSASRPLAPGEEAEHRFDVDGEPFPWHITEPPAGFSVLKDHDVYLVRVEVIPIERDGNNDVLDVSLSWWPREVRIGDRPFPWAILRGSLDVTVDDGGLPMLHLTFIAEHVDADLEILDLDMWTARTAHEAELERMARVKRLEAHEADRHPERFDGGTRSAGFRERHEAPHA